MSETLSSVVLIDDDQNICNVFRLVMNHHSIHHTVYNDAETALQDLVTDDPTVILLDIFLPGMDGYQALRNLPQRENYKVVATTAYYTADTEKQVFDYGFDGFIRKPFIPNKLVEYLEGIIE